jgi:hypothetical protein
VEEKGRAASVGMTEKITKAKAPAADGGRYEGKWKGKKKGKSKGNGKSRFLRRSSPFEMTPSHHATP